jgi:DNA-nicking Smr family endonuclease
MARKLDEHERYLWQRVVTTVKPMDGKAAKLQPVRVDRIAETRISKAAIKPTRATPTKSIKPVSPVKAASANSPADNLDGSWDRRFGKGSITPDISIDLHGSGLSQAYARLDGVLAQAIAQNLRVVLLVTGNARTHDRASGRGRGAIAALVRDWLAASRHARSIAAVRNAHPRHGGSGALYIVLKR